MTRDLGIYVHVPFCRTRCRYCDFYRVGENRPRMDAFLATLGREIEAWRELEEREVVTVFLGGGTPSLLEPAEIGEVLERLRARFRWREPEITVEANPSDLELSRLAALRRAGVNRLSIGVQSFSDRELGLLGRRHDAGRAVSVVGWARDAGFDNLSLDLMLAIPGQTEASFRRSLERAVELAPEHLSLYLLEVHGGSEMDGLKRTRPGLFPGEEAARRRYLATRERLLAAGYEHYEISNFARPGRKARHNLRYWRGEDWLGLGPAAHSSIDGRRFCHPSDLNAWLADPRAVEELPGNPALERLFMGLRLSEGVGPEEIAAAGLEAEELDRRLVRLAPFVERSAGRLRLTPEGFVVSNPVIAALLP